MTFEAPGLLMSQEGVCSQKRAASDPESGAASLCVLPFKSKLKFRGGSVPCAPAWGWCLGTHTGTLFPADPPAHHTSNVPRSQWGEIAKLHKKSKRSLSNENFSAKWVSPFSTSQAFAWTTVTRPVSLFVPGSEACREGGAFLGQNLDDCSDDNLVEIYFNYLNSLADI